MREIKFRAWQKFQKKMSEPFDIRDVRACADPESCEQYSDEVNPPCNPYCSTGWGLNDEDIELMQYTGLKDKNGKEIYEGDIMSGKGLGNFIIKIGEYDNDEQYEDYDAGVGVYFEYFLDKRVSGAHDLRLLHKDSEVIGNQYENPELIEKQ